jgi:hypothetical protein
VTSAESSLLSMLSWWFSELNKISVHFLVLMVDLDIVTQCYYFVFDLSTWFIYHGFRISLHYCHGVVVKCHVLLPCVLLADPGDFFFLLSDYAYKIDMFMVNVNSVFIYQLSLTWRNWCICITYVHGI